MASPMRKKRAWSTREDDAESKETAAFEATVAAAQDTAAKSGAFLSTAKEDLTDHKRWLKAQSVAVERDRARHERWLQRQRDHRLASARKERAGRRRQLMRQRAVRAVQAAIWASLLFVQSWILLAAAKTVAGIKYVGLLIARGAGFMAARIADAARFVAHLIAAGTRWTFAKLGAFSRWTGREFSAGASWSGAKAQASARAGGTALASGSSLVASKAGVLSRSAGRSLGSGLSAASTTGSALADATGRSAAHGFAVVAEKASALQAASKRGLAAGYRWTKTRGAAIPPALYVRVAKLGRQAERYARTRAARPGGSLRRVAPTPAAPAAVIEIYGPHEAGVEIDARPANEPWTPSNQPQTEADAYAIAEAQAADVEAQAAEVYGPFYEGFWVEGISPNEPRVAPRAPPPEPLSVASPVRAENALSSWAAGAGVRTRALGAQARAWAGQATAWAQTQVSQAQSWTRTRDIDLSQMMVIAGAVLLVCGGLLLGGGLFLRAGAGTMTAAPVPEEAFAGITWSFQEIDRPLPERAVFTLSGTPASFRINGLSVSGVNQSDQPLAGIEAVLKPDVQRPELKLTLKVDKQAVPVGSGDTAGQALEIVGKDTVPAHAPFRLVFPFPPEAMGGEDGITIDEFFDSYGGLLLKLRYKIDGAQKSLIQYLPPDLLKSQLDEVAAEAAGG